MAQLLQDQWAQDAEQRVLNQAIILAGQIGWNERLVKQAAGASGLSKADTELLLPKGPADLAALLMQRHDAAALSALNTIDPSQLKVRERVHAAVEARIDAAVQDEPATKACGRFLMSPAQAPLALRLGWATADVLWRWAGDTATDENHYSKRAILSAILLSTLAVRLSGGHAKARTHLGARIDQVMAFETWKATGAPSPAQFLQIAAHRLGRLRYGSRAGPQA